MYKTEGVSVISRYYALKTAEIFIFNTGHLYSKTVHDPSVDHRSKKHFPTLPCLHGTLNLSK